MRPLHNFSLLVFFLSDLCGCSLPCLSLSSFYRLYSCLANGSPDEFQRGEQLYRIRAVKDPLQIGELSCRSYHTENQEDIYHSYCKL